MRPAARTTRSKETPMDFEFTSRPSSFTKPAWATGGEDPGTPRKRTLEEANPPSPVFPPSSSATHFPTFVANANVPFLFQEPMPHTPHPPAWQPPPNFSPEKAFPQPELKDVDMVETTPPKVRLSSPERDPDKSFVGERVVATGAMRRVFKSRQKAKQRSRLGLADRSGDEDLSEDDDEEHGGIRAAPFSQTTSNHYTLNMPGPAHPPSSLPYILLGYLQFFFNFSLILVFLYLLVQFILTVQRDVEQRISEYSMDIVQEIAQCTLQYKTNKCASNSIPAMTHQCAVWETCMSRDPSKVGRAKVGAELIAEVVNGFVEPITWKTLIFTLSSLAFLTVFINALLSLYRSRVDPAAHIPIAPHHATPSFPLAPYPPPHQYLSPPSEWPKRWPKTVDEDVRIPTRRRRLEGRLSENVK